eukprot:4569260-Amphidinium_carterae.1
MAHGRETIRVLHESALWLRLTLPGVRLADIYDVAALLDIVPENARKLVNAEYCDELADKVPQQSEAWRSQYPSDMESWEARWALENTAAKRIRVEALEQVGVSLSDVDETHLNLSTSKGMLSYIRLRPNVLMVECKQRNLREVVRLQAVYNWACQ